MAKNVITPTLQACFSWNLLQVLHQPLCILNGNYITLHIHKLHDAPFLHFDEFLQCLHFLIIGIINIRKAWFLIRAWYFSQALIALRWLPQKITSIVFCLNKWLLFFQIELKMVLCRNSHKCIWTSVQIWSAEFLPIPHTPNA